MLDFRFQVADPEKAKPLFDRRIPPYLVDRETGAKVSVPDISKIGPVRPTDRFPEPGKNYFMLFPNPGGRLKRGDRASIVVGDFRTGDLVVE